MTETEITLDEPRIQDRKAFYLAGLTERYNIRRIEGIGAQWDQFAPQIGQIPGRVGHLAYGVCYGFDGKGNMDYLCGVEVSEDAATPAGLKRLRIDEHRWAVFFHREHISKIKDTWQAIFKQWAPASPHALVEGPQLEVYAEDFDHTKKGGVEIWIPVAR
jgi:AraC family transcriptional regulator